jgi:hypothetical protein
MAVHGSNSRVRALAVVAGVAVLAAVSACDLPFNLGQPSTRALESGAANTLVAAQSFEITGSYTESVSGETSRASDHWTIDLQVGRLGAERVVVSGADSKLEAIILGEDSFFRGNQFLSQHMGDDTLSRTLVKAAGNAWWRGSAGNVPRLPDFTDGRRFSSTFLGTAVTKRSDHVLVDGLNAVLLSGPRADVYVAANPPNRLLRVRLKSRVTVDGISEGDFRFENFNRDFGIAVPTDVIDFSNLSTLPPVYSVMFVDTSGCGSPCVVSALVKNLGGMSGATAPSTISFALTDSASGHVLSRCQSQVKPDVGYNATTSVSCNLGDPNAQQVSAATVTATADNPGRA